MKPMLKMVIKYLRESSPKILVKIVPVKDLEKAEIEGLKGLREVIITLESLGIFPEYVQRIKKYTAFSTNADHARVSIDEANYLKRDLAQLSNLVESFVSALAVFTPKEEINSVNIKFPDVSDFDELSKYSREIHLALTQVIFLEDIGGETRIQSVENGSIWVNVMLGTSAAVSIVASIVWSATVVYKKMQEGKLLAEQVRGLGVKNDGLEEIVKLQTASVQQLIEAEAQQIKSKSFKDSPADTIERLKNSIKMTAELIDKGAEFKPSLMAPESVSNLFPNPKAILGLDSPMKRITDGEES